MYQNSYLNLVSELKNRTALIRLDAARARYVFFSVTPIVHPPLDYIFKFPPQAFQELRFSSNYNLTVKNTSKINIFSYNTRPEE